MNDILSAITDDSLRRLYLYWDGKRAGRRFPARRDIDPLDISYVLGWVLLVDVLYDPLRFAFRVYGSELAARVDHDLTGKSADEHPSPPVREHIKAAWREVITQGKPIHGSYSELRGTEEVRLETLRLPLSSDGTTIDMLLVGIRPIAED